MGLRVAVAGPVATLTLDRPEKHNPQTPATWLALAATGRDLPGDVRVVVIRGAGRSFSAGLDRAILSVGLPATEEEIAGYQAGFSWLGRPDIVSIAAVQGYALGAGCQLALACDMRILAEDAQLALPEPSLGLVPDLGGTAILVDLVGYPRALEICLTGRKVAAAEAFRLGLAELVVATADLDAAVDDLVTAVLGVARDAAVETKMLLRAVRSNSRDEQLVAERQAQVRRLVDLQRLGE